MKASRISAVAGYAILSLLSAKELELGSTLPLGEIKMLDISGDQVSLEEALGPEGLLVIFSCNTCPWVLAWEDRYVTLAEKYQPQGIGMIALNPNEDYRDDEDSYQAMQDHARKKGYNFYYAIDQDSQLARAFGASRTPHIFLFDKNKKLIYRGAIDDNARHPEKVKHSYLVEALDACLEGKAVQTTSTKALGCTIKFKD